MSANGGQPGGSERRRVDPDSLPDVSMYLGRASSPHGRSAQKIVLLGAVAIAVAAGGTFLLRGVLSRAAAVRRSASALAQGVPGGLPGLEQPAEKRGASPQELAALQKSWVGSENLAPRDDRLDRHTGERVGAFQGFGLQVDSAPPGARVVVNGQEMGTSPLLTSVECDPGDEVAVEVDRAGERARATTLCRKDTLVKLQLRLKRRR